MVTAEYELNPAPAPNAHSVSNFNPSEYEVLDYLDNQVPRYTGGPLASYESVREAWRQHIRQYFPTSAVVTSGNTHQLPEHNIHKCRHCGQTNVRYIVAVRHIPTDTNLVFGDVCVGHLGFRNHNEFRAAQVRARAAQGNANLLAYNKRLKFLNENPALKSAIESGEVDHEVHANNFFVKDVLSKLDKYGALSPRQVESVLRSLQRDREMVARRERYAEADAQRRQTANPAPNGRATVEGKIVVAKIKPAFGGLLQLKMMVLLTGGSKVWCSVPSNLSNLGNATIDERCSQLRGKCVRFKATFTPKEGDAYFAWGTRPSNGEFINLPDSLFDQNPVAEPCVLPTEEV